MFLGDHNQATKKKKNTQTAGWIGTSTRANDNSIPAGRIGTSTQAAQRFSTRQLCPVGLGHRRGPRQPPRRTRQPPTFRPCNRRNLQTQPCVDRDPKEADRTAPRRPPLCGTLRRSAAATPPTTLQEETTESGPRGGVRGYGGG